MSHSKPTPRSSATIILIVMHFLLGAGAMGGGGVLIADPTGGIMGIPLSLLNGVPFKTFLIPGIALFVMLGVFPFIVGMGLINKKAFSFLNMLNPSKLKHWTYAASLFIGVYLIGWTVGEMILWGWVWLSAFYCLWGVVTVGVALVAGKQGVADGK